MPKGEERRKEDLKYTLAAEARKACKEKMQSIFPNFGEKEFLDKNDIETLKDSFRSLGDEVHSARQVFSHRHQETIIKDHVAKFETLDLSHVRIVVDKLKTIVKTIAFIYEQASYGNIVQANETYVSDQIDLMLFGSIANAIDHFYDDIGQNTPYWEARNSFYSSKKIIRLLANPQKS